MVVLALQMASLAVDEVVPSELWDGQMCSLTRLYACRSRTAEISFFLYSRGVRLSLCRGHVCVHVCLCTCVCVLEH